MAKQDDISYLKMGYDFKQTLDCKYFQKLLKFKSTFVRNS